ncbi:uncharacterized protein LOC142232154 [Haematobia irritans]|uniref:uncharacterized protein LOC142232154 n=1 Tax=Haematobia irritans TaxID=7368 RepID=UPI003F4FA441
MSEDQAYKDGDIVWVKLGNNWWPGEVIDAHRHPDGVVTSTKRKLYCIVKFFNEDAYEYVSNVKQIYPFQSPKKEEFLKKGLSLYKNGNKFMEKFPEDVEIAERLTRQKPQSIYINDRPDSIVKAILGQPLISSGDDGYCGTVEYREKRRSCESVTKIINLTPSKTASPIKPIRIEQSIGASSLRTPTNTINKNTKNITISPRVSLSGDSSSNRNSNNNNNNYRCNLCDFTSVRQNVMILHRKMHSNRNGPSTITSKSNTTSPNNTKNNNHSNNIESNTKVNKTLVTKNPPDALMIPARTDRRSTISPKTLPSISSSTTVETVVGHSNLSKSTSSPSTIVASDASCNEVDNSFGTLNESLSSRRSMRNTRTATVSTPSTSSNKVNDSPASQVIIDLQEVKPIQKIPKKRDFANLNIHQEPATVPELDAQEIQLSSMVELSEDQTSEVLKEDVEQIRNMLLADWSDEDESPEQEHDQNKNETKIKDAEEKRSEERPITVCSNPTVTSTPSSSTKNAHNKTGRIRNIPKKDRRDVILHDFSADVSVIEPPQEESSQNVLVHLDTSNSSAVEIVEDQGVPIITINDDDECEKTKVKPKTSKKNGESSRHSNLENVVPNDKSAAETILSCFDFQDDEDDDDIDTPTAVASSIAHFKKKYLSTERNLNQIPSDGAAVVDSKSSKTKQEERAKKDRELEAEIETLLNSTQPPPTESILPSGNRFEDCISVKDLPIKERSKRIFKSRNRSRAEIKLSTESLTNSMSTDESLTKDISLSEEVIKTKRVSIESPKEKETNDCKVSLNSSREFLKTSPKVIADQEPNNKGLLIPDIFQKHFKTSDELSQSSAMKIMNEVEKATIQALTELASVEEDPDDDDDKDIESLDHQKLNNETPSSIPSLDEEIPSNKKNSFTTKTPDANKTPSDMTTSKTLQGDSNLEENKEKSSITNENKLGLENKNELTNAKDHDNSEEEQHTTKILDVNNVTTDVVDVINDLNDGTISIVHGNKSAETSDGNVDESMRTEDIIIIHEEENHKSEDENGKETSPAEELSEKPSIEENISEPIETKNVDELSRSNELETVDINCSKDVTAVDTESSVDGENIAVLAAPEDFISHRIVTTSPVDENSSMGASDTGAEFGSPTSMLSEERLPAFPFSRNGTPHPEFEATENEQKEGTLKISSDETRRTNIKSPSQLLPEEETLPDESSNGKQTTKNKISIRRIDNGSLKEIEKKSQTILSAETDVLESQNSFASPPSDKSLRHRRHRQTVKTSRRIIRDALKNSVSKNNNGDSKINAMMCEDQKSNEIEDKDKEKGTLEILKPESDSMEDSKSSNNLEMVTVGDEIKIDVLLSKDGDDITGELTTENITTKNDIQITTADNEETQTTTVDDVDTKITTITDAQPSEDTSIMAIKSVKNILSTDHNIKHLDSNISNPSETTRNGSVEDNIAQNNLNDPKQDSESTEKTAEKCSNVSEEIVSKGESENNDTEEINEKEICSESNQQSEEGEKETITTVIENTKIQKKRPGETISFVKLKQRKQQIEEDNISNKVEKENCKNQSLTLKSNISEESKIIQSAIYTEKSVDDECNKETESKICSVSPDQNANSPDGDIEEKCKSPLMLMGESLVMHENPDEECKTSNSSPPLNVQNPPEEKTTPDIQERVGGEEDFSDETNNRQPRNDISNHVVDTQSHILKGVKDGNEVGAKNTQIPTENADITLTYKSSDNSHVAFDKSSKENIKDTINIDEENEKAHKIIDTTGINSGETQATISKVKTKIFNRKTPITRRQTICFDDFEDASTLTNLTTPKKRTSERKMTMPDMARPSNLRTESPFDSKRKLKSQRRSSFVQDENELYLQKMDEMYSSSKALNERLSADKDTTKNSKPTSNGRNMKRRASSRRQSMTIETPPQSKIPRDASGFVAIQPKVPKADLMVTNLDDSQISAAQQQLLQLQQQPQTSPSSIVLNKNSSRARKTHKTSGNSPNQPQNINPLVIQPIQAQQSPLVTSLTNTQTALQFVQQPIIGIGQQHIQHPVQQTTEGFLITTPSTTSEEESVIDSNTQLIALPTQPYPGYNETFLLCKVNGNTCKPVDNVPLYLNHQLNELVPIPSDVLEAGPKQGTNDEMKETNTQETQRESEKKITDTESGGGPNDTESSTEISNVTNIGVHQDYLQSMETDATTVEAVVGEDTTDINASNGILLNIEGQQVLLDAATFAHLLANPDTNTQLISDDGTEYVLTHEVLQALHMQQQQQQQEEQQQILDITNAGVNSDIIAVAMAGSDLYGNEVLTIDTSQGLQLIDDNGSVVFQQPTEAPPMVQQHLTPPAVVTNAVLDQSPIMSTLEVPSNSRLPGSPNCINVPPLPLVSPSNVVFGGDAPSNLDDSLAAIGVTAQSSSISSALGLPITVTDPNIASKVTSAGPLNEILQFVTHRPATGQALAAAAIAGESRIFND